MANYLKLHRKMLNWGWYDDINTKVVFLHCLLKTNWLPGEWHGIEYKAGEFITSLETLSNETHLSISQVRTAIKHLEMTGEITSKSQGKCRLITVNNWDAYQGSDKEDDKEIAGSSQSRSKVVATDIDIKNIDKKNSKRFVKPTVDEVRAYCLEKGYTIDPQRFVDYYESNGWMIGGKSHVKDWKAAVRTWQSRQKDHQGEAQPSRNKFSFGTERKRDDSFYEELEAEADMRIVK